jgi:CubicO group peptidase (beta-lactamase class C family)
MRMKTSRIIVTIPCLLFFAIRVFAGTVNEPSKIGTDPRVQDALRLLEIWVDARLAYERLPGISMAVVHDQETIWSRGFGFADVDAKRATTPDTIYSICSISKLFTSIAVMKLRDEGKLRLDDPVGKYLSWFNIQESFPDAPDITLRNILTHSSGLPRESDYPYWTGPEFPFPTHEQIVEGLSKQKTLYPADRYFQYSNLGLTLAGEIVAAASGQPYQAYVEENILGPLGLHDTTPFLPEEERGGRFATGYGVFPREGGREEVPFFQARGVAPAAGYASTANDLAKFASWQFRLLDRGGEEVLEANTLREMYRVHWVDPDWETTRGLGFSVSRHDDHTFVGHGGSCPGFRTQLQLSPKDKIATIFMTNAMGVDTGTFTMEAYEIVAPAIEKALESPGEAKKAPAELEKYTGLYRDFWGESAVLTWEGGLAMVSTRTRNPSEGLTKLKHIEGHVFRRIRENDEGLGEEVVFEVDTEGRVVRMRHHGNYSEKVR